MRKKPLPSYSRSNSNLPSDNECEKSTPLLGKYNTKS
jgi:hypothetical protein